ncbi:MAG: hypothetical protein M3Z35_09400 [Nitrospirota bacterium]|nr:hypothetical protein [Nitrospirota bacterium]
MMLFYMESIPWGCPQSSSGESRFAGLASKGAFLGVDERVFPRDFAVFMRYYLNLLQTIPARYPMMPASTMKELDEFLNYNSRRYAVRVDG